ncbi:CGNR zinc finger domain-containing protein [Catenuloplanes japonicus]|uniref:CGNR zinc finger domain-containing protein n=1 Tax=Catenuloplanes japonicus TaxID=33876 RepID=UPI000A5021ED|nr:CGNR zinc finger domain-containing protein [Catenuloplanes japonicus]
MDDLRLVEEFLNTVDERTFRRHGETHAGGESLGGQQALDDWLADHGLPRGTGLEEAITLRTALRKVLSGEGTTESFPLRLRFTPGRGLGLTAQDRIVEIVAHAVATGSWARVKLCAAQDCRWAFYDTSKSGGGRWCAMNVCGNRAKTRAYRRRHTDGQPSPAVSTHIIDVAD